MFDGVSVERDDVLREGLEPGIGNRTAVFHLSSPRFGGTSSIVVPER